MITFALVLTIVVLFMLDVFLYHVYGWEYFAKYEYVTYNPGVGLYMFYKIEKEEDV